MDFEHKQKEKPIKYFGFVSKRKYNIISNIYQLKERRFDHIADMVYDSRHYSSHENMILWKLKQLGILPQKLNSEEKELNNKYKNNNYLSVKFLRNSNIEITAIELETDIKWIKKQERMGK